MAAAPITRFRSTATTAAAIADEIAAGGARATLSVVFASSDHDLGELGQALAARGVGRMIGASTGRVIGAAGVEARGVTGFHLPAERFVVADALLEDAAAASLPEVRARVRGLLAQVEREAGPGRPHRFALLLVDAEARCEERLAATLGLELSGIPLVGGSAGDVFFNPLGRQPVGAPLLYAGRGLRGAALLCLVASSTPLAAYCHNHYVAGERKVVVTAADPPRRLVREIDGRPALGVYTALCGLPRRGLHGEDFAPYPLMVRIGGQFYARGVQRIADRGALEFACAIERGLVATLARPGNMVARLEELFADMRARIGTPELVIGLDCAARAAYMEREGLTAAIGALLTAHAVTGFATLGEQYNTVHANNSFTCLGLAAHA